MRLASAEVIPYALPFKEPYVTARGTLTRREMVLLRLRTDEGIEGLGEAVPLSLRGGTTIERVVRELEEVANAESLYSLVEREAFEISSLGQIDPRLQISTPARCAVLCALMDLWEKTEGMGERAGASPAVPCNATLVAGDPGKVAEDALAWAAEGFSTFKLKLGANDDLAQVRAVREAVGPEAKIRLDANGAWTLSEAIRRLDELLPFGIELVEQPVATMHESALLVRVVDMTIAGDESVESVEDARLANQIEAFAVTGVKLSKVGGPFEAMAIADARSGYMSSALDGPVGIAWGAALATSFAENPNSIPGIAHGLATQRLFASTIAAVECELRDGWLHPPPGPGLGVVIDEDALRAHRL